MRAVLQRVRQAEVFVAGQVLAKIGTGYLILLGFGDQDHPDMIGGPLWNKFLDKLTALRLFPDTKGPINAPLAEQDGILVVSQFTLYADVSKGRRPSFAAAAKPEAAQTLFDAFVTDLSQRWPQVGQGVFGADMDVSLVNWGPVTIWLDSDQL